MWIWIKFQRCKSFLRDALTCLKSCGFEIARGLGLPGVPPSMLDIKFFGFNVP